MDSLFESNNEEKKEENINNKEEQNNNKNNDKNKELDLIDINSSSDDSLEELDEEKKKAVQMNILQIQGEKKSKNDLSCEMMLKLMQPPGFVTKEVKHKNRTYHAFTGKKENLN